MISTWRCETHTTVFVHIYVGKQHVYTNVIFVVQINYLFIAPFTYKPFNIFAKKENIVRVKLCASRSLTVCIVIDANNLRMRIYIYRNMKKMN